MPTSTQTSSSTNSAWRELTALVEEFDSAMLVTVSRERALHARPMAIAGTDDPLQTLFFVTDRESPKVSEIDAQSAGLVSLQAPSKFVSLSGTLTVDAVTRSDIDALWQPKWRVWFAGDEESARLGLIRFAIDQAEFWDRSGAYRWRILWRQGRAVLGDERLDDQALPGHARVDVRSTAPD